MFFFWLKTMTSCSRFWIYLTNLNESEALITVMSEFFFSWRFFTWPHNYYNNNKIKYARWQLITCWAILGLSHHPFTDNNPKEMPFLHNESISLIISDNVKSFRLALTIFRISPLFLSMNYIKLVNPLHFISWKKKKKTANDAVTPQCHSQFTPKMKANTVPRLLFIM